jgi:hypothetical protein
MVGVYALFLPAIGVAILALLRSAGMVFGADVDAAIHLGLLIFGDSAFLLVALTLASFTFFIEVALQQVREQRAAHPRPS